MNYADNTGESTLNVTLTPDGLGSGFIGIYTVFVRTENGNGGRES